MAGGEYLRQRKQIKKERNSVRTKIREIQERIMFLEQVIADKEKENEKLPKGHVRSAAHGNGYQYYLRKKKSDKTGTYINKANQELVQRMIQREYNERIIQEAKKELYRLKMLEYYYNKGCIEDIYEKMPLGKRLLIEPIAMTDQQFLDFWMKKKESCEQFREESKELVSAQGEKMRSKSEIIIADLLDRLEIPYIYELPLQLRGGITVHPDFTLIDVKHRRVIYWEHLGMLDDEDYVNQVVRKIRNYEENGYYLGEQLLITGETKNHPLDISLVKNKLQHIMS